MQPCHGPALVSRAQWVSVGFGCEKQPFGRKGGRGLAEYDPFNAGVDLSCAVALMTHTPACAKAYGTKRA